ncbi:MAG: glutamate formimidoyltransferase [Acidobacteria bacterium]|nr:glutamate formimidoyltransferase [Acidobacteriota bacterium]
MPASMTAATSRRISPMVARLPPLASGPAPSVSKSSSATTGSGVGSEDRFVRASRRSRSDDAWRRADREGNSGSDDRTAPRRVRRGGIAGSEVSPPCCASGRGAPHTGHTPLTPSVGSPQAGHVIAESGEERNAAIIDGVSPAPFIEAIPNISEGRRPDTVRAIVAAAAGVPGIALLDCSSDRSHHRSVLTLAGTATSLREAIFRLFDAAITRIDLRGHAGAHPRIGAVDVVPFVPLGDMPMAACIGLARDTAAEVAARFDLPTYLYAEAAGSSERQQLNQIRRGGFEGLAAKLRAPEWAPDHGPARPHPTAGAAAFGARGPLIAFNVNLASADIDAARAIARAVRERDGGLPAVQALGLRLAEREGAPVQVSMNLTDHRRTSISAAVVRVTEEAAARGIAVAGTELVGLAPAAAAESGRHVRPDQTIEARLAATARPVTPAIRAAT